MARSPNPTARQMSDGSANHWKTGASRSNVRLTSTPFSIESIAREAASSSRAVAALK